MFPVNVKAKQSQEGGNQIYLSKRGLSLYLSIFVCWCAASANETHGRYVCISNNIDFFFFSFFFKGATLFLFFFPSLVAILHFYCPVGINVRIQNRTYLYCKSAHRLTLFLFIVWYQTVCQVNLFMTRRNSTDSD